MARGRKPADGIQAKTSAERVAEHRARKKATELAAERAAAERREMAITLNNMACHDAESALRLLIQVAYADQREDHRDNATTPETYTHWNTTEQINEKTRRTKKLAQALWSILYKIAPDREQAERILQCALAIRDQQQMGNR